MSRMIKSPDIRTIALEVFASLVPILFLQRLGSLQRDDFFRQTAAASKSACADLCPAAPGWLVDYFLEITGIELSPSGTGFTILAGVCLIAAFFGIRLLAESRGLGSRSVFLSLAVYALFIWNAQWQLDLLVDAAIAPYFLLAVYKPARWAGPIVAALMVLWVNASSGFILGLLIVAMLFAGSIRDRDEAVRLLLLFVLALLAAAVNPQKTAVFETFLHGLRSAEPLVRSFAGIQGADLHVHSYIPKFIALLLFAQMFILRRANWPWNFLVVGAVIAPLLSPLFFVLLGIVCAVQCGELLAQVKYDDSGNSPAVWSVPASVCALCAFLCVEPGQTPVWNRFNEAAEKVNSAQPVFNDAACANELAAAGVTPFLDRRQPLLERGGIPAGDAYARIIQLRPGWEDLLKRASVRFALLREDSRLASVLRYAKGWTIQAQTAPLEVSEVRGKKQVRYILLAGDLFSR